MKKHPSDNIALLSQHGLLLCSPVFVLLTLAACGGGGGDTSSSGSILSISDSDLDGEESSGNDNDGTSGSGYTVLAATTARMQSGPTRIPSPTTISRRYNCKATTAR